MTEVRPSSRFGWAAVGTGAAALLLLSVAVFLLLRAVTVAAEPAEVTAARPPASTAERLVESPKKFLTYEERLAVVKDRLTTFIARTWHKRRDDVAVIVEEAVSLGKASDIDPILILGVITVESGFNEKAVSKAGAQGLMQVHVRVHADKFEAHGGAETAFDPKANMAVGTAILVKYLAQQKTVSRALKFYVGAGYRKGDGGYARRVFLAESRLLAAVGKSPDEARQLVLRKKEGPAFRLMSGKNGDWSDFLALVRRTPV